MQEIEEAVFITGMRRAQGGAICRIQLLELLQDKTIKCKNPFSVKPSA